MFEHYFFCPHCWQEVSMLLDASVSQIYIEDCEVCCNPIEVNVVFNNEELISFGVNEIGQ